MPFKAGAALMACLAAVITGTSAYVVPGIEYPSAEKGALAHSELELLKYALGVDGVVAFKNIPGLSQARRDCLVALGTCYEAGLLRADKTLQVVLADGTTRVTLASEQASDTEDYGCPGLGEKKRTMQAIVDSASMLFARALDETVVVKEQQPLFAALDNPSTSSYQNFASVVAHGAHLDHFHVYEKSTTGIHDEGEALERHTDQGLFVAIVPSISIKNGVPVTVNDGFEIELPAPRGLTRITIPNNGDAVLFMLGDGMANWIHSHAIRPLRVVPHRLVMQQRGVARAWFGRMFFPPKDAYIQKHRTTFEKIRTESVEMGGRNLAYAGCSSRQSILRDLTVSACGANEIWCWMGCQLTGSLHCTGNQTIECVNTVDNQIWTTEEAHCPTCAATCHGIPSSNSDGVPTPAPVKPVSKSSVCNTNLYPTNMYMNGFNGIDPNVSCIIFLFQSWVLDTEVKLAFGSIGAFLVGFVIEYIIVIRRETKRPRPKRSNNFYRYLPDSSRHRLQSGMLITLYGIQLVLAYFAMLLAMTFSTLIFFMVMLGLTIGHFTFNSDTPAGGNEACCAANEDDEDSSSGEATKPKVADCCSTNVGDAQVGSTQKIGNCCGGEDGSDAIQGDSSDGATKKGSRTTSMV